MMRTAAIAIAALFAALLASTFFAALPAPLSSISLPLIVVIGLVTRFRFSLAWVAAAVSGVTADALSAHMFGISLALMLAATWFAIALFTKVFTHASLPAFIGIHAAGFAAYHAARFAVAAVRAFLDGTSPAAVLGVLEPSTIMVVLGAFTAQLVVGFLVLGMSEFFRKRVGALFFVD